MRQSESTRPRRRWAMRALAVVALAPVAALGIGSAATAAPAPDPGSMRGYIVYYSQAELGNSARNHAIGSVGVYPCNWYSGYWSSGFTGCSTGGFRANNWCADFARYVWRLGGARVTGTSSYADSFRTSGVGTFRASPYYGGNYSPVAGDAILFDWNPDSTIGGMDSDGSPDTDHVGIVESVSGGTVTFISGNSNGSSVTSRGSYALGNSYIVGYTSPVAA